MKERKTKVGKLLQSITKSIPSVATDVLGVVMSPNPVGAAVKTLVGKVAGKDSGLADQLKSLTDDDWSDYKLKEREQDLEELQLYLNDMADARSREIAIAQTGKSDFMMPTVGLFGLVAFLAVVYVALFMEIKNENLFYFIAGNVLTIVGGIFGYYFGTSKSSSDKTKMIKN